MKSLRERIAEKLGFKPKEDSVSMLVALQGQEAKAPGSLYQGTADRNKVAKRHAKNKAASASRRINRRTR